MSIPAILKKDLPHKCYKCDNSLPEGLWSSLTVDRIHYLTQECKTGHGNSFKVPSHVHFDGADSCDVKQGSPKNLSDLVNRTTASY